MQIQFAHAPVHTPEQVHAILVEAVAIADGFELAGPRWKDVFCKACDLLGARASVSFAPQPVDLSALALPNGAGR